jgi:hypothetical protein
MADTNSLPVGNQDDPGNQDNFQRVPYQGWSNRRASALSRKTRRDNMTEIRAQRAALYAQDEAGTDDGTDGAKLAAEAAEKAAAEKLAADKVAADKAAADKATAEKLAAEKLAAERAAAERAAAEKLAADKARKAAEKAAADKAAADKAAKATN